MNMKTETLPIGLSVDPQEIQKRPRQSGMLLPGTGSTWTRRWYTIPKRYKMKKRNGPLVTVNLSCKGCVHERTATYILQDNRGINVYCNHPDIAKTFVGDTGTTPQWCPVRPKSVSVKLNTSKIDKVAKDIPDPPPISDDDREQMKRMAKKWGAEATDRARRTQGK